MQFMDLVIVKGAFNNRYGNNSTCIDFIIQHIWELTVPHYPRNMVIYHNSPIGVIFMVILHVFIIKNHPNLFPNYYPKYTIWVIYPFILNFGKFIYKVISPEHNPIVREETAMLSYFGIMFLIDTMISNRSYTAIISIKCTRGNGNAIII